MTHPRLRRHRSRDGRQPVFAGGFPDDGRDITEVLGRADRDGRTPGLGGASDAGLPGGAYDAWGAGSGQESGRGGVPAVKQPEPGTGPPAVLRARRPAPDTFPALPDPPAIQAGSDTIIRDMARGWPHLFEVRCACPAAASATPIPCGSAHRDPAATSFRALRRSAQVAGWHLDALGRWACARCCQASPEYRSLYPVTVYDIQAAEAYVTGDLRGDARHRARAEHDLVRDVRDTARRGRHAAGARWTPA